MEVWRILLKRYAPRTLGTKRAILDALFTMRLPTSVESMETVMLHMEETARMYDGMPTNPMPDDIKCAIMIANMPKRLKG